MKNVTDLCHTRRRAVKSMCDAVSATTRVCVRPRCVPVLDCDDGWFDVVFVVVVAPFDFSFCF